MYPQTLWREWINGVYNVDLAHVSRHIQLSGPVAAPKPCQHVVDPDELLSQNHGSAKICAGEGLFAGSYCRIRRMSAFTWRASSSSISGLA